MISTSARDTAHPPIQSAFAVSTAEIGNQIVRRHEVGAETGLNGRFRQRDTEMSLADARRPEKNYVAGLVNETQGAQLPDLPLVDRRLKAEVEVVEGLHKWQVRQLKAGA
jgi:hypothetical protein